MSRSAARAAPMEKKSMNSLDEVRTFDKANLD